MFCPPGYALIEDIFPRILDRSYVVSTDHDLKPDDEVGQYIKHSLNAMFALQMFLESCPSLSVCSPDGVVLRVSRRILTRLLTDGKKSDHRYFECIDEETWLVDVEAWERPTQASSSVDMVVEALLRKQRNRANFFSRFSGWSLSVRAEDVPEDAAVFDLYLKMGDAIQSDAETDPDTDETSGQIVGRPPKVFEALIAYCRRFPSGRQGTPMKVVRSQVSEQMGKDCSETTMRRVFRLRESVEIVLASPMKDSIGLTPEGVATLLSEAGEFSVGFPQLPGLVLKAMRAGYPFK